MGTDFTTKLRTSQLHGGDPFTEKHAGEIMLYGYSGRTNLTVTLFGTAKGSSTLVQVQQWTQVKIPTILPVFGQQQPMVKYVVDIQGQGDFVLKSLILTYKKVRIGVSDAVSYSADTVLSGGVLPITAITGWLDPFGGSDTSNTEDFPAATFIATGTLTNIGTIQASVGATQQPQAVIAGSNLIYLTHTIEPLFGDLLAQTISSLTLSNLTQNWTVTPYASPTLSDGIVETLSSTGVLHVDSNNNLIYYVDLVSNVVKLRALNPVDGTTKWTFNTAITLTTGTPTNRSYSVAYTSVTNKVFLAVLSSDGTGQGSSANRASLKVFALNTSDGTQIWSVSPVYPAGGIPAGFTLSSVGRRQGSGYQLFQMINDGTNLFLNVGATFTVAGDYPDVPWITAMLISTGANVWDFTTGTVLVSSQPQFQSPIFPITLFGNVVYTLIYKKSTVHSAAIGLNPTTGAVSSTLDFGSVTDFDQPLAGFTPAGGMFTVDAAGFYIMETQSAFIG